MHRKTVIDFRVLGERYTFTQPIKELKTRDLAEVVDLMAQVESYQEQGYYVVGYVSYEAAPAFEEKLAVHKTPLLAEYLLYFTVHDRVETSLIPLTYDEVNLPYDWQEVTSAADYEKAIAQIHHHLRQGDTYQVNYTVQLKQDLSANPFAIYNRMVVEQEAGYNAYVEHDEMAVISMSPELFFEQNDRELTTRPMKGTTKRGLTDDEDLKEAAWLEQDPKNRSENMMIVDLLRNDMNRISEVGSEHVERLCQVEQYSTVWQMTSTIKSQLREDVDLVAIFRSLFPCGSITGAPKIATMEIIKDLEPKPRGVYCGTIGLLLPNGRRIFNVAIRTIQLHKGQAIYGVGGGITWDSTWESEYREVHQKAAVLYRKQARFKLITTGKISQKRLLFEDQHLKRLTKASRYFSFPFGPEELRQKIEEECQACDSHQDYRLRITISKSGEMELSRQILTPLSPSFCKAKLCLQEADLNQSFTYFKTTHRPHLSLGEQEKIYHNKSGELLETSIGNLVLKINGKLYTPPTSLGILPGIYRQYLLETGQVDEKVLTLADLNQAEAVYGCNAVRGLYELEVNSK
ncbi:MULTISPECIES: aminodeoxychorismate synthase component I [Streptococcus]|uniref:aminodeoxychorismate synthase component I n=1 Tax=Streptococcus TaxID=1301 RepID=UPI00025AA2F9|nr:MULTISPECIES: aminodeoxychorismate synthase component I [Streptococcus]EID26862.1 aminodeoxychorismate synthase, component I [Streptococcus oralis SK1074]EJO18790.1 aminodeoxychorismate synthase, component I [Streptococcus sp. BS35b]ETS88479.1 aminodeoxychorismate synthase, component I [Streptococcus sp. BS29a]EUB29576.1 aminodeoxychorismate synthase, component I [Streptococcus sp. BS21]MCY7105010.1 aminodeoxychorismate synthase component I [Streptococcus oralis]